MFLKKLNSYNSFKCFFFYFNIELSCPVFLTLFRYALRKLLNFILCLKTYVAYMFMFRLIVNFVHFGLQFFPAELHVFFYFFSLFFFLLLIATTCVSYTAKSAQKKFVN